MCISVAKAQIMQQQQKKKADTIHLDFDYKTDHSI